MLVRIDDDGGEERQDKTIYRCPNERS